MGASDVSPKTRCPHTTWWFSKKLGAVFGSLQKKDFLFCRAGAPLLLDTRKHSQITAACLRKSLAIWLLFCLAANKEISKAVVSMVAAPPEVSKSIISAPLGTAKHEQ